MKIRGSRPLRVLLTERFMLEELREHIPHGWDCQFDASVHEDELSATISTWNPDVVFTRLGLYFNRTCFEASAALKLVATPTTGLDHIDLEAGRACGVEILSLRGQTSLLRTITSTAEHAWALLLAASRSLPESAQRPIAGDWSRGELNIHQLAGKQLGLIGIGRLGAMLAEYGRAFQMKVVATDPRSDAISVPDFVEIATIKELLNKSDYLIVAASYSHGDLPILRPEHFDMMKTGVILVNVSRGELIDEEALVHALKTGVVRSAGLDVLTGDSRWTHKIMGQSPLLDLAKVSRQVIVTPHTGGYAVEAVMTTRRYLIEKVANWFSRSPLEE